MKWTILLKSSNDLLDPNNWKSNPTLNIEERRNRFNDNFYNRYELVGYYKTVPLLSLSGSFNENRQWNNDSLGIWDKEKTNKYVQLAKEKGIVEPIWISIDEDDVKIMEGNHRIKLAERLNIDYVPVKITFDSDALPSKNYFNLYNYIEEKL